LPTPLKQHYDQAIDAGRLMIYSAFFLVSRHAARRNFSGFTLIHWAKLVRVWFLAFGAGATRGRGKARQRADELSSIIKRLSQMYVDACEPTSPAQASGIAG